ncbi:hypothetical protein RYX36_013645 [Vicia faba]
MSEVVNSLVSLYQKFNFAKTSVEDGTVLFDKSLQSADTRFKRRGNVLGRHLHNFQTEAPQHHTTQWLLFEAWKHLLVYDYFVNLTLYDALHSGVCETLSWTQSI